LYRSYSTPKISVFVIEWSCMKRIELAVCTSRRQHAGNCGMLRLYVGLIEDFHWDAYNRVRTAWGMRR
jgi:hypothetical protein